MGWRGSHELSPLMPRRMRGHGPHSSCRVTGFPEEPSRSPTSSSIRPGITGPQLLVDSRSVPVSRFWVLPILCLPRGLCCWVCVGCWCVGRYLEGSRSLCALSTKALILRRCLLHCMGGVELLNPIHVKAGGMRVGS